MPFCWPQFGPGEIQQHGFLRNQKWTLVDWCQENAAGSFSNSFLQDAARAVYEIYDTKYSFGMWKRKFFARYSAHLTGGQLLLDFRVKNLDTKQIEFTGALHTYYAVRDIDSIEIRSVHAPVLHPNSFDASIAPTAARHRRSKIFSLATERVLQRQFCTPGSDCCACLLACVVTGGISRV